MPDIGHLAPGLLAARWYDGKRSRGAAYAFCALSFLPDLDLVGRALGRADGSALGHRGAMHSLAFAAAVAVCAAAAGRRRALPARRTALFAFFVVASHGALDMLDTGPLGVAYLWPFSSTLFFWPWRFLPGPPPGEHWLTLAGARAVAVGALYFAPVFLFALRPDAREASRS